MLRGFRFISRSAAPMLPFAAPFAPIIAPLCLAGLLAGCSMSFPISPLISPKEEAGEALKPSLANLLDGEDWRRAKPALSAALDPQGSGALVWWENPQSGHKGSFTPLGSPYPYDARICRVFLAKIDRKGAEQSVEGTACSDKGGEWSLAEAKPERV